MMYNKLDLNQKLPYKQTSFSISVYVHMHKQKGIRIYEDKINRVVERERQREVLAQHCLHVVSEH